MTSTLGIGVPVPKMLPVTGTWALPFAAYLVFLSGRVVARRVNNDSYVGEKLGDKAASAASGEPDRLQIDSRCQANFIEYVPFALALSAFAELNGADRKVLSYALAGLFAARIVHAELGLQGKDATTWGRPAGFFATQGFLAGIAGYGAYLVKGYWGY